MLAFTMQFSKHERTPTHNHHQHPTGCGMAARPARTPKNPPTNPADEPSRRLKTRTHQTRQAGLVAPVPSGPNSVTNPPARTRDGFPEPATAGSTHTPDPGQKTD
jgi:hypothetical protein